MIIECIDNGGFEDQLSDAGSYRVIQRGVNSYLIENDLGQERWYGTAKFEIEFVV